MQATESIALFQTTGGGESIYKDVPLLQTLPAQGLVHVRTLGKISLLHCPFTWTELGYLFKQWVLPTSPSQPPASLPKSIFKTEMYLSSLAHSLTLPRHHRLGRW